MINLSYVALGPEAAMLIRIRVLNEQLIGTEFADQPRS
jgi:hypothetical protein